ncbi:MAG: potassium-transporting ATPase subunit KdpC [Spirochaetes bacterium]|nr:MAG: potassium-transporting ATPase subunit KdpC [Spirochaetota bacterium]
MNTILISLRMLIVMTLLGGVIYPLAITGAAQALFRDKARGSIVVVNGNKAGSALLAQPFAKEKYFHPRPSAADFATLPSGAGNKGLTSADLKKAFDERKAYWSGVRDKFAPEGGKDTPVPADLLFASGSGLDPHISPEAARLQTARVAAARAFTAEQVVKLKELVEKHVEHPTLGFLGEPRVNVLLLNIDLDAMK